MTLEEWQHMQRKRASYEALEKAIAWFKANGMTAEEIIRESNRILHEEQGGKADAIETRKEEFKITKK